MAPPAAATGPISHTRPDAPASGRTRRRSSVDGRSRRFLRSSTPGEQCAATLDACTGLPGGFLGKSAIEVSWVAQAEKGRQTAILGVRFFGLVSIDPMGTCEGAPAGIRSGFGEIARREPRNETTKDDAERRRSRPRAGARGRARGGGAPQAPLLQSQIGNRKSRMPAIRCGGGWWRAGGRGRRACRRSRRRGRCGLDRAGGR